MEETRKRGFHYGWVVVLGCGLMIAGTVTFLTVLVGNFYVPAATELGTDYSSISLYYTFVLLGIAISLPFVGNLLPKIPPLGFAALCVIQALAVGLLSVWDNVSMWWITGGVVGLAMGFTSIVCISTIITNWFSKRIGFAIGLVWAIASVISAIMSPVITEIVTLMGWRTAIVIFAVVSLVLTVPSSLFLVIYSPERKGLKPYGYDSETVENQNQEEVEVSGVPFKKATRSLAFVLVALGLVLTQILAVLNTYFPTYADSVGFDPSVGALMISIALIFDIALNPFIGWTLDKFGAVRMYAFWLAVVILSFGILLFSAGNQILAYLGAGINDTMYVLCGVGIASVVTSIFGAKDYAKIFSYVVMAGYLAGCVGPFLIGAIYDMTGSFEAVFGIGSIMCIVIAVLFFIAQKAAKKLPQETEIISLSEPNTPAAEVQA